MDYVLDMKTATMVKAGRELAGWSQAELASRSGLSLPTIQRMENPQFGPLRSSGANLEKLRSAFALGGVSFVSSDGKDCVCIDRP
ncbi:helix-turn-helix domain-containing protein [Bosea sp. PAMC 26642]|uniref:helix-turn-helix domain-containing protein n=1 Tax=Bosea sp. (strain PAMC 26642) TaxID=1792307 RepID=UPI002FF56FB2